jgi:FKBP-type peptidyl-prolyl cis-trans isomerase 2
MTPHADAHAPTESGDLVLLDYELWAEGAGRTELVDTTREEVAQKADLKPPEGHKWGAHAHLIGGDYFPGGVENALVGAKIGEEWSREFPPAEAFGDRDPKLIELFSMHEISRLPEMRRDDASLDIGTVLTIKGRRGRVVTLTAARVRVDFNPAFAGRTLKGTFKVVSKIHEPVEKARAVIDLTYGRGAEFKVDVEHGTVTVTVPDRSKFDFGWAAAKPRVIDQIRTHLKPQMIRLVEEFATPAAREKAKDAPGAQESESPAAEAPVASDDSAHAGHAHSKPAKSAPKADEP